jgi:hypothetical protein
MSFHYRHHELGDYKVPDNTKTQTKQSVRHHKCSDNSNSMSSRQFIIYCLIIIDTSREVLVHCLLSFNGMYYKEKQRVNYSNIALISSTMFIFNSISPVYFKETSSCNWYDMTLLVRVLLAKLLDEYQHSHEPSQM